MTERPYKLICHTGKKAVITGHHSEAYQCKLFYVPFLFCQGGKGFDSLGYVLGLAVKDTVAYIYSIFSHNAVLPVDINQLDQMTVGAAVWYKRLAQFVDHPILLPRPHTFQGWFSGRTSGTTRGGTQASGGGRD